MRHFTFKHKLGFTMIELVMVIVVLGIIASLALPRLALDHKQEAADSILSNIRYTQHLAINDDMHIHDNPQWQRRFWQIMFTTCNNGGLTYRIGSDDDMDNVSTFEIAEAAIDPINGKPIYGTNTNCNTPGTNPNVLLGKKYGVNTITGSGACSNIKHIGFDHLGRPHLGFSASATPDYSSYMKDTVGDCIFTFTMQNNDTFKIRITPETGYAYIDTQNNS